MTATWAKLIGDGVRAEGYEEWMQQTLQSFIPEEELAAMPAEQRARVESRMRIGKVIIAAAIETARGEQAQGQEELTTMIEIVEMMSVAIAGLIIMTIEPRGCKLALRHISAFFAESLAKQYKQAKPKGVEKV